MGIEKLAQDKIREIFKRYDSNSEVEILSGNRVKVYVDKQAIPSIIGRGGSNINNIEKQLDIHIDIEEKTSSSPSTGELPFSFSESKTSIVMTVGREYSSMYANIFVNEMYVTSARIGKKGLIKIPRKSETARNLLDLASSQKDIHIFLKDF